MTTPPEPDQPPLPRGGPAVMRLIWRRGARERRLQRIREEIERNRTDGPSVPTWVWAVALVLIIAVMWALVAYS